ncbi:MAG: hypothetical protein WED15_08455, partial [Akkermansiaceae bacterium]
ENLCPAIDTGQFILMSFLSIFRHESQFVDNQRRLAHEKRAGTMFLPSFWEGSAAGFSVGVAWLCGAGACLDLENAGFWWMLL